MAHTIKICAILQISLDKMVEVRKIIQSEFYPTIKEQGCLSYQAFENSGNIVIVEQWQNIDCLRAHFASPLMGRKASLITPFVTAPIEFEIFADNPKEDFSFLPSATLYTTI